MPDLGSINEAGPWAVLAFVLISGIVAVAGAFVKKVVVPGWLYDLERKRSEVAETQAERNATALETLAGVVSRDRGSDHAKG